jgi:hypothetical protein
MRRCTGAPCSAPAPPSSTVLAVADGVDAEGRQPWWEVHLCNARMCRSGCQAASWWESRTANHTAWLDVTQVPCTAADPRSQ